MASPFDLSNSYRGPTRLTRLYIAALSAIAILSFAGQLVIQNFLYRQRSDSTVVNVAGRQRMLSQKLTKAALAYSRADTEREKESRLNELRESLALWERSHQGLQQGDRELRLPGRNSATVQKQFHELQDEFSALRAAGQQLLKTGGDPNKAVQKFLQHEASFLAGMDAIVSQYDLEAQQHVANLQFTERALFVLTLGVLLLEGMFVFRPAVRHIQATLEWQRTSAELRRAKEVAEATSQAKSHLLANTSHELRTPLHAILGMSEQLESQNPTDEQRHQVAIIRSSAATLLQLVTDLLDFAAIESGRLQLRAEQISIPDLVADCVAILRASIDAKNVPVLSEVDPELPTSVFVDGLRLKQLLLNLGGNAVKFTERGSITVKSKLIHCDNQAARVRFSVSDTGIGIPELEQPFVFEPFTRLEDSPRPGSRGIGLGLSICRHLVQLLGGELQLESEVGRGSEFSFELALMLSGDTPSANSPTDSIASLIGQRVLVVDDAPVNRELAVTVLQGAGCEVVAAADGQAALDRLAHESFDAVLLDLRMPGLSGGDVAKAIQQHAQEQNRPPIPIIALTADGHAGEKLEPNLFREVLLKPASRDQILAAVSKAIPESADRAPLMRLRGDRDLLSELRGLFANEAPQLVARIEAGVREDDPAQIHYAAHRLRGQALQIGADEIADLANRIESSPEKDVNSERSLAVSELRSKVQAWL